MPLTLLQADAPVPGSARTSCRKACEGLVHDASACRKACEGLVPDAWERSCGAWDFDAEASLSQPPLGVVAPRSALELPRSACTGRCTTVGLLSSAPPTAPQSLGVPLLVLGPTATMRAAEPGLDEPWLACFLEAKTGPRRFGLARRAVTALPCTMLRVESTKSTVLQGEAIRG